MHIKSERTCVVCRNKKQQQDMFRLVKIDNCITLAEIKSKGKGIYVCKNNLCVQNMIKTKSLNKALKCNIDITEYQKVQEQLIEKLKN